MGKCHKGTKEYEQDDEIDVQFLALTHGHRGDSVLPEFIVSPFNFTDITYFGLPRSGMKRSEDNLGIWQKQSCECWFWGFFRYDPHKKGQLLHIYLINIYLCQSRT